MPRLAILCVLALGCAPDPVFAVHQVEWEGERLLVRDDVATLTVEVHAPASLLRAAVRNGRDHPVYPFVRPGFRVLVYATGPERDWPDFPFHTSDAEHWVTESGPTDVLREQCPDWRIDGCTRTIALDVDGGELDVPTTEVSWQLVTEVEGHGDAPAALAIVEEPTWGASSE